MLLLLGGFLGAFLRVALGQHQTWHRRTILSIVMGGATAVVLPSLGGWLGAPIPVGQPPLVYISAGVVIGGFGDYILVALLWRAGVFKSDVRAEKPNGGGQ